jgi:heme exporter protein CcmD
MTLGVALGMGRYGGYVWSCYGLTLCALVLLAVTARHRWRSELNLARRRAATPARASAQTADP